MLAQNQEHRKWMVPLAGLEPARCCHHLILSQDIELVELVVGNKREHVEQVFMWVFWFDRPGIAPVLTFHIDAELLAAWTACHQINGGMVDATWCPRLQSSLATANCAAHWVWCTGLAIVASLAGCWCSDIKKSPAAPS
jgi:hypothetical protein